jgi:hypothetical protein
MRAAFVSGMLRFPSRHRLHVRMSLGGLAIVAWLQGCSYVRDQVAITTTRQCVDRECGDEVGAARPRCEGECYRRYRK